MAKIVWDGVGEKIYETGVDHGVLYPIGTGGVYSTGVPWNGLTGVTESSSGAESTPQYADNIKYLNILSAEEFGATIEAFTYPPEFRQCDGSAEIAMGVVAGQQTRRNFGFCYRVERNQLFPIHALPCIVQKVALRHPTHTALCRSKQNILRLIYYLCRRGLLAVRKGCLVANKNVLSVRRYCCRQYPLTVKNIA